MGGGRSKTLQEPQDGKRLLNSFSKKQSEDYAKQVPAQNKRQPLQSVSYGQLQTKLLESGNAQSYSGKGMIVLGKDDAFYDGQFKQGQRHGQGSLAQQKHQQRYTGEWKLGFMEGEGTLYSYTKSKYYPTHKIADVEARKGSTLTTNHKISLMTDELAYSLLLQAFNTLCLSQIVYFSIYSINSTKPYLIMSIVCFILSYFMNIIQNWGCQTMKCLKNVVDQTKFKSRMKQARNKEVEIQFNHMKWHMGRKTYIHRGRRKGRSHRFESHCNEKFKYESAVDFSADIEDFLSLGWNQDHQNDPIDYCFVNVILNVYFTENARQSYQSQIIQLLLRGLDVNNILTESEQFYEQEYFYVLCRNYQVEEKMANMKTLYHIAIILGFGVYMKMWLRSGRQIMDYSINKYVFK